MVVVGEYEYNPDEDYVGSGSYATVFTARHVATQKLVVLKIIHLKDDTELTLPMLRECSIHKELKHPNILRLEAVLVADGNLHLVLEFMNYDLRQHFGGSSTKYGNPMFIKGVMKSLLSGLAYCHSHNILHRDIKPENLLITDDLLKIADFGSARGFTTDSSTSDSLSLTPDVVTVDYRAPEVLLGSTAYSRAIDMWGAGCIFGEISSNLEPLFGRPSNNAPKSCSENYDFGDGFWENDDLGDAFSENDDLGDAFAENDDVGYEITEEVDVGGGGSTVNEVLERIFSALGVPDENTWPGVSMLKFPEDFNFSGKEPTGLGVLVPRLQNDPAGIDLLSKLLCLNPEERITAQDALDHPYFAGSES